MRFFFKFKINHKILLIITLIPLSSLKTLAQYESLIVAKSLRVELTTNENKTYYDLVEGYSNQRKDSIKLIILSRADSTFFPEINDSITFHLVSWHPKTKENLKHVAEKLFPIGDTSFFYVRIGSVCKNILDYRKYASHESSIQICSESYSPLYYKNGRPIFSEEPKENKLLKKKSRSRKRR